jgi:hypothetical protein
MAFLSGVHFLTGSHCKLRPNTEGVGLAKEAQSVVFMYPHPNAVPLQTQAETLSALPAGCDDRLHLLVFGGFAYLNAEGECCSNALTLT